MLVCVSVRMRACVRVSACAPLWQSACVVLLNYACVCFCVPPRDPRALGPTSCAADGMSVIAREEGVSSLFNGLPPSLVLCVNPAIQVCHCCLRPRHTLTPTPSQFYAYDAVRVRALEYLQLREPVWASRSAGAAAAVVCACAS
jgi:hypothetical protein